MPNIFQVAVTVTFKDSKVAEDYIKCGVIENLLRLFVFDFNVIPTAIPLLEQSQELGECSRYFYGFDMAWSFNDDPILRLVDYFKNIESVISIDCWYIEGSQDIAGGRIFWQLSDKKYVERQTWEDLDILAKELIIVNHLRVPMLMMLMSTNWSKLSLSYDFDDEDNWLLDFITEIQPLLTEEDISRFPELIFIKHFSVYSTADYYAEILRQDYPGTVDHIRQQLNID